MNQRKSAADLLREKCMSSQLKKVALDKVHPNLDELFGMEYLKNDIQSKIHNPLFNFKKYFDLGTIPPKSLLIRGIDGVGKSYLVKCFCQTFQIPLLSNFIESVKDIKELFSKSKSTERSIILIRGVNNILAEESLIRQLNESIEVMDWNCLVIITNKESCESIFYDNEIFVKIPSIFDRKLIFDGLLKNINSEKLETLKISQNTPGFVPRDIVKLISMCSTRAVSRSLNNSSNMSCSVPNLTAMPSNINPIPNPDQSCPIITMDDFANCISDWKNITQNITFDDIGALNKVKEELTMSILLPSRYPEKFNNFGITRSSGVLLYGPPGCGKTLIAKAVSNMSHCNFLSIKGPELITKYVGDSEKHLRDLFQKAKNLSPCVLFFDEIDSLCSRRGKNEFGNRIVNQILTLLDGIEDRGEVYLIGATNRIDTLDEALMRPGRFDKIVEVTLPDSEEALEIFGKCVSRVPHEKFNFSNLNFSGLSGADISGIVKEAAIMCLKENFDKENLKISENYFKNSIEKMKNMKRSHSKK
jgi:SpoVK/Ycf46/Vps4 family AAA+-type ATPase